MHTEKLENYDFSSGTALLSLCTATGISISEAMLLREIQLGETTREAVLNKLSRSIEIMRTSTTQPLTDPIPSMGGLIGGEAQKVWNGAKSTVPASSTGQASSSIPASSADRASSTGPAPLCGMTLSKAIAYAMAVLEVNASMGLIVAAPTAGSSGVIPGAVLSVCEDYGLGDAAVFDGLLNASAIGYLFMRNASVAGAEAGCQAEVGAASAMAASAIAQLLGGSCRH